jgi:hypothetical protein
MDEERFDAISRSGDAVVVRWRAASFDVEIRVGEEVFRPAWGSQACDDWLDWMAAQRRGESMTLPLDEDDWLLDEGYHR